jgi:hypothetical protein
MVSSNRRGDEIRFVAGKYIGYKGWLDATKDDTALSYPVVVSSFKKKDGSTVDLATTVRKTSVCLDKEEAPVSYAEAIMQQHPKIEQLLMKLCKQLAKCELSFDDTSIHTVIAEKLREALALQLSLGSDAEWKRVRYTPPSM